MRVDKASGAPSTEVWMDVTDQSRALAEATDERCSREGTETHSSAEQRGLFLVGIFKICKAVFFLCVAVGAIHLIHRNIGELVMRIIDGLPIDPEGRVVSMVMDKADLIDAHDLRRIGAGAFIYAVLCVIEGSGLLLRKSWAEYFTLILTTLGLPLELFELTHRVTPLRLSALLVNLVILFYLLWVLKRQGRGDLRTPVRL